MALRWHIGALGALAALLMAAPVAGGPVAAAPPGVLPEGAAVIDIRAEDACLDASLPGARCLPAPWLLTHHDGGPIDFHALRWLLGTVGLTGAERLTVYAGAGAAAEQAWAVAGLIYLAGQREVRVLEGAVSAAPEPGESRSFSREAVYTAPMRRAEIALAPAAPGTPARRLAAFARDGGPYLYVPQS